jgi:predicted ATP-dependent serine protease
MGKKSKTNEHKNKPATDMSSNKPEPLEGKAKSPEAILSGFNPISAKELLSREPEPMVWILDTIIPEGTLFIVAGFMKTGKSTLTYPMAVAIAQGEPFLDFETKQTNVLIISVEEHERDVRARLERFGLKLEDPLFLHCAPLKNDPATRKILGKFIEENEIGFVMVDTLSTFWDVDDENSNAKVMAQVKPLLDMVRKTGASICLIHHTGKSGGSRGREIRGASALFGVVDFAITLDFQKGSPGPKRQLKINGRYADSPPELSIELVGDEYILIGGPPEELKKEREDKFVALIKDGAKTVSDLKGKSALGDKATRSTLKRLLEKKLILQEGKGTKSDPRRYSLLH